MSFVLSACATIRPAHCVGTPSPKACNEVFQSKFNQFENDQLLSENPPDFPGFIISIDKSKYADFDRISTGGSTSTNFTISNSNSRHFDFTSAQDFESQSFKKMVNNVFSRQRKNMFVTGIRTFQLEEVDYRYSISDNCGSRDLGDRQTFIDCSVSGLDEFQTILTKLFKTSEQPYSHVIVHSTGWHNRQKNSIEHYNELFSSLDRVSDRTFNPLYIGLTWPADWAVKYVSYLNKANDADEVGLIWANYLINRSIPEAINNTNQLAQPKYVVLGHSFGARLVGTAVNSRKFLTSPSSLSPDTLVLIQPAFSSSRFMTNEKFKNFKHFNYYEEIDKNIDDIVVTSSLADNGNRIAFWSGRGTGHVGTGQSFNKLCGDEYEYSRNRFICRKQTDDDFGNWRKLLDQDSRILYLRLDGQKNNNQIDTDIIDNHNGVRKERFAKVLWDLIK